MLPHKIVAMKFGIIGSGSWATALAKILTDNNHHINWWMRSEESISYIQKRRHNPHYLTNAHFDLNLCRLVLHSLMLWEILKYSLSQCPVRTFTMC